MKNTYIWRKKNDHMHFVHFNVWHWNISNHHGGELVSGLPLNVEDNGFDPHSVQT